VPKGGDCVSAPPYMQLYVAEYTAAVQGLTCEQDGAYWRLLRAMWIAHGKLPRSPQKLAVIVGVSLDHWTEIGSDVLALFDVKGDTITHKRLLAELRKASAKSEARKEAGKRGGQKKASNFKENSLANATVLPEQKATISESESDSKRTGPKGPVQREVKPRGSKRCPIGWSPSPSLIADAAERGFTPAEIDDEVANIRDHEFQRPYTDWDAVAAKWFRRATPKGNRNGFTAGSSQGASTADPRRANTESRRSAWAEIIAENEPDEIPPADGAGRRDGFGNGGSGSRRLGFVGDGLGGRGGA